MNALFLGLDGDTSYLDYFGGLEGRVAVAVADSPELLHHLPDQPDESFDAVFVSAALSAQARESSFPNWLRIVRKEGSLFLENGAGNRAALIRGLGLIEPFIRSAEAVGSHTTAVRKKSGMFPVEQYLQAALDAEQEGLPQQALYHYTLARNAAPGSFAAAQHLALFYERQHRFDWSERVWRQMLVQQPGQRTELAHVLSVLASGDYPRGFRLREDYADKYLPYERRSHAYPPPSGSLRDKRWRGEDLTSKTLAVWSEFGLGDEIMFASLATALKRHFGAARLVWVVQPPLVDWLRSHPDIDEVASAAEAGGLQADYWDFPHALLAHTDMPFAKLPKRSPYLFANRDKRQAFDTGTDSGCLKIGLVWRGDPTHENDAFRSLHRPECLEVLTDIPGTAWFSLQKSLNADEEQWLASSGITDWRGGLNDFSDTAAALSQLDLLVSADTSVVHAAGALGIPALVLLPFVYDWRWGRFENGVSGWYPSVYKIFAPSPLSDWTDLLEAAAQEIRERVGRHRA